MELTVGAVVEGKVRQITNFGAFIALDGNQTGMVHISEVAHAYVNDIHDFLTDGQTVKVMVIGTENGKINLSIKRTAPPPPKPQMNRPRPQSDRPQGDSRSRQPYGNQTGRSISAPAQPQQKNFDDMLKQFMSESDSKMSSIKQYSDHKTKTRRR